MKTEDTISWKRLFKKFPFFKAYNHFIQITVLSNNEESSKKWEGFVESKVRQMLYQCQNFSANKHNNQIEFRPWPKTATIQHDAFQIAEAHFIGIRLKFKADPEKVYQTDIINMGSILDNFYSKMMNNDKWLNQEHRTLLESGDIDIQVKYVQRDQLPPEVRPEAVKEDAARVGEVRQEKEPMDLGDMMEAQLKRQRVE
jgi:poly(A) polymerase